jgi:hypothetical protein
MMISLRNKEQVRLLLIPSSVPGSDYRDTVGGLGGIDLLNSPPAEQRLSMSYR